MPHSPCLLTTKDHTILEVMLERCLGLDDPLRPILQEKLRKAVVVFADEVLPTVVTLNSRVAYRVNGGAAETRIVAHDEIRGLVGRVISITVPRGLALLGLAEGQSFHIRGRDGADETVTVQEVAYQPEAAKRLAEKMPPCRRFRAYALYTARTTPRPQHGKPRRSTLPPRTIPAHLRPERISGAGRPR